MRRFRQWFPPWDTKLLLFRATLKGLSDRQFSEFRQSLVGLGGSDIAQLMCYHEGYKYYSSPHQIFLRKLGELQPVESNDKMSMGSFMESTHKDLWRYYDGTGVMSAIENKKHHTYINDVRNFKYTVKNPDIPGAFFNIDGLIRAYRGEQCWAVYEGKTVEFDMYRIDDFEPYPHHLFQVQAYMWGLGIEKAILFYVINGVHMKEFVIKANKKTHSVMAEVVDDFCNRLRIAHFQKQMGQSPMLYLQHKPRMTPKDLSKELPVSHVDGLKIGTGKICESIVMYIEQKNKNKAISSILSGLSAEIKDYMIKAGASILIVGPYEIRLSASGTLRYKISKKDDQIRYIIDALDSRGIDYTHLNDRILVNGGDVDMTDLIIPDMEDIEIVFNNNGHVDLTGSMIMRPRGMKFDNNGPLYWPKDNTIQIIRSVINSPFLENSNGELFISIGGEKMSMPQAETWIMNYVKEQERQTALKKLNLLYREH